MADWYVDTDIGVSGVGTTWATAFKTLLEAVDISVISQTGGDRIFMQGSAVDTYVTSTNFDFPANGLGNPTFLIGVADGTTAEPPTDSDLATTFPTVAAVGSGVDTQWQGAVVFRNIHIDMSAGDNFGGVSFSEGGHTLINCLVNVGNRQTWVSATNTIRFIDCEIIFNNIDSEFTSDTWIEIIGGSISFAASPSVALGRSSGTTTIMCDGVDLSLGGFLGNLNDNSNRVFVRNCKLPATYNLLGTATNLFGWTEVINSSDTVSVADSDQIDVYEFEDSYGSISLERTVVRTGGATDGITGEYSLALTPRTNNTTTMVDGYRGIRTSWLSRFVTAGTHTITVYICNDGGVDYNDDEVWMEVYSPSSTDSSKFDISRTPSNQFSLVASSTIVTDDVTSTWGGTGANPQKLETTVTCGYQGYIRARVYVTKRQATPDTVFVDPRIEIT